MTTQKPKWGLPDLAVANLKWTVNGLLGAGDSPSSQASSRPTEFTSAGRAGERDANWPPMGPVAP